MAVAVALAATAALAVPPSGRTQVLCNTTGAGMKSELSKIGVSVLAKRISLRNATARTWLDNSLISLGWALDSRRWAGDGSLQPNEMGLVGLSALRTAAGRLRWVHDELRVATVTDANDIVNAIRCIAVGRINTLEATGADRLLVWKAYAIVRSGDAIAARNPLSATLDYIRAWRIFAQTDPPVVKVSDPIAGSVLNGKVYLAADVSDNDIAGLHVHFLVDGQMVATDYQPPFLVQWNTWGVKDGVHSIIAVAHDTAGNEVESKSVRVTVDQGLVAAYSFDEASGTAAGDASGKGNNGQVSGATRVGGLFGNALSFDGVNDMVTVPDSPSLRLSAGMTIEAWVKPTTLPSWPTVLMKEGAGNLAYALYANNVFGQPNASAIVGGSLDAHGVSSIPVDAWTHLAATFDGSEMRLFVNGDPVGTRKASGLISSPTGALRIGGNSIWGEYFDGLIDQVRVYKRALGTSEIQADMAKPIG